MTKMRRARAKSYMQQRYMAKQRQDEAKIGLTLNHNYKEEAEYRRALSLQMVEKFKALKFD